MDDVKKALEELEKTIKNATKDLKEKNKENIDKATKAVKESCDKDDIECLVYMTNKRCITTGTGVDLLGLLASFIDKLCEDIPLEGIVISFLAGTCQRDNMDIDKDTLKEILDIIERQL